MTGHSHQMMRDVGFLVYDGVQGLDVVGPFETFFAASQLADAPAYRLHTYSLDGHPVRTETGLTLGADGSIASVESLDTLVIPGGAVARTSSCDPRLVAEIGRLGPHCNRMLSICTGAFPVAQAGLASGKRITTHWKFASDLARRHPDIQVDADRLFLNDNGLFSSAGVLAGVDLALSLVEADLGEAIAIKVARELVLYLRRTGGQAQFSEPLRAQSQLTGKLAVLSDWIRGDLTGNLSVETLASRAGLSERHFRRVLRAQAGVSPARFVENIRLDVSRELLILGEAEIKQISAAVGFHSDDIFRRAFRRRYQLTPSLYRERFSPSGEFDPTPTGCAIKGLAEC